MKRFFQLILIVLLLPVASPGQQLPHGRGEIAVRYLASDFQYPVSKTFFKGYSSGTELEFVRRIGAYTAFALPLRAAQARYPNTTGGTNSALWGNVDLQFQLRLFPAGSRFNPFAYFGIGAEFEEGSNVRAGIPVGGGIDLRLAKGLFLSSRLEYRYSDLDLREQLLAGIGLKFTAGNLPNGKTGPSDKKPPAVYNTKDQDGDGIPNDEDDCPGSPGERALKGCPDRDGDGTADYLDQCPDVAGNLAGCPDADNDGIADQDDQCPFEIGPPGSKGCPDNDRDKDGIENKLDDCPDIPGPLATKGCPDRDNDGLADNFDNCPDAPGPPETRGCPDSDLDGIPDKDDRCPNTPGLQMPDGCPDVSQDDLNALVRVTSLVQFETGSDRLKEASFEALDLLVTMMRKYPDFSLRMIGHTDNVGNPAKNLALSESRAQVCYEYLISRGIGPSRMRFEGLGGAKPVASNNTAAGRALNRRVEFILSK
jgi:outer membrane protein OmpA-like peptidoglycan-associated protein